MALAAPAPPQAPVPRQDPYTRGEPETLEALGYRSFGPFDWGDAHRTNTVDRVLGDIGLRWVETRHFRLGSSLPAWRIPPGDRTKRDRIRQELEELAVLLPRLEAKKVRVLDPWLRLHLYAFRLERLYAEFSRLHGLTDADFPAQPGELADGRFRGQGPWLGMRSKFTVLLFEKQSDLQRYAGHFLGQPSPGPRRYHFLETGSLFFGTATELADGAFRDDLALYGHVVFNVTHNLVAGFQSYNHEPPFWYAEGLAHWLARKVNRAQNNFSAASPEEVDFRMVTDWARRVRARAAHDYFPSMAEILGWAWNEPRSFADHMMLWSRVDHLIALDPEGPGRFLARYKEPFPGHTGLPTREMLLERQDEALAAGWGRSPEDLDLLWRDYVRRHYPSR